MVRIDRIGIVVAILWLGLPPAQATEVCDEDSFRVLTLNLRSRFDSADAREVVIESYLREAMPEVVLLQEVGRLSPRSSETQADRLARRLGYEVAACHNRRTSRGLAILSRYPIVASRVERLPYRRRPALGVVLAVGEQRVSVVNVHLTPTLAASRTRQAELRAALGLLEALPGPGLIGGDFNFGDDARENRLLSAMADAFRSQWPNAPGHTWDLRNPLASKNAYRREPSRRLDRILSNTEVLRFDTARIVLNAPTASGLYPSDHFGVLAAVSLLPSLDSDTFAESRP